MTDRFEIENKLRRELFSFNTGATMYTPSADVVESLCRQYIELRERSRAETRPSLTPVTDAQIAECMGDGIDVCVVEMEDAP